MLFPGSRVVTAASLTPELIPVPSFTSGGTRYRYRGRSGVLFDLGLCDLQLHDHAGRVRLDRRTLAGLHSAVSIRGGIVVIGITQSYPSL
jgi:hypothetical protein